MTRFVTTATQTTTMLRRSSEQIGWKSVRMFEPLDLEHRVDPESTETLTWFASCCRTWVLFSMQLCVSNWITSTKKKSSQLYTSLRVQILSLATCNLLILPSFCLHAACSGHDEFRADVSLDVILPERLVVVQVEGAVAAQAAVAVASRGFPLAQPVIRSPGLSPRPPAEPPLLQQ